MKNLHNIEKRISSKGISRRGFLKLSTLLFAGGIATNAHADFTLDEIEKLFEILPKEKKSKLLIDNTPQIITQPQTQAKIKKLHLYSVNSRRMLDIEFFENGKFIPEGLREIYKLMSDNKTGTIAKIDTEVITTMYELQQKLNTSRPLDILSGYRSPETNAQMAHFSRGVAKDSFHTHGKAVDLTVKGMSISEIHKITKKIHNGGIGYYPSSHFVHLDVGPQRHWMG